MNYINYLPHHVIECPEIGAIDVYQHYQRFVVQITDAWGKTWYIQTVGKNHYDWTRSMINARCFTEKTAQKHTEIIKSIWYQYANEKED